MNEIHVEITRLADAINRLSQRLDSIEAIAVRALQQSGQVSGSGIYGGAPLRLRRYIFGSSVAANSTGTGTEYDSTWTSLGTTSTVKNESATGAITASKRVMALDDGEKIVAVWEDCA